MTGSLFPVVLDLCGGSGAWSEPYRAAGYDVRLVDLRYGDDVRLLEPPLEPVHGVLAAPPCTSFSSSGARWWRLKGDSALVEGLSVVDACLRIVAVVDPVWWVLENPVGRLRGYLGPPVMSFDVRLVDLRYGDDVRLLEPPLEPVHGVLAAPPCTSFSSSGARWWRLKGDSALVEGLSVVDACLRIVAVVDPVWWVLENPVGRLRRYLGPPVMSFDPCDFGDPWTKRTQLWGHFNVPVGCPVEPVEGSKMWRYGPSAERSALRSITSGGFARAFFEANP